MQLKDSKVIHKAVVLLGVAALTGAIGVGLSAQMGPRPSQGGQEPGGPGRGGMMGGPGMMRGGPGGPGMMRGGPGGLLGLLGPGMRDLNITDAQREQIRAIAESHKADFDAIRDRTRAAREALHDATIGGTADEAVIREKAAAVAAVDADAAVLQWKLHSEVTAVLTPEQLQKAKQLRETMKERMKNGPGRMMRRPQPPEPAADERSGWHDDNEDGGLLAV